MFAIFLFPCFIEAKICKTLMKIDGYPYSELISEVEAAKSLRSSTMDLSFPYSLRKGAFPQWKPSWQLQKQMLV